MNTSSNSQKKGRLAVLTGNTIFGFSFLFSRLALDTAEPAVLIATRFLIAFLILNLVIAVGRCIKTKDGSPLISFSLKGKPLRPVLLLSLCQPVIYFIAENYGLLLTSSSFAGIMIALIPLAGILVDMLFMHAKASRRNFLCAGISVIGVLVTTIGAGNLHSSVPGLLILMVAVGSGAMFYVLSSNAGKYYSPLERTYVMFGVGTVFYWLLTLVMYHGRYTEKILQVYTVPMFWVSIAYLAAASSVIAFLLLNYGSSRISVSQASIMANLTTVISIAAGVLILHESFSAFQLVGAVLIIASVYTSGR